MERIPSSAIDQIAAYQLVLGCLPERDQWLQALRLRKDGSSPELVLKVLAAVRMELYIRMGDLVAGEREPIPDLCPCSTAIDRRVAYQILLDQLSHSDWLQTAVQCRRDGSQPHGVFSALDAWRMELRARLGDTVEQAT
jgi:hypothetical protein